MTMVEMGKSCGKPTKTSVRRIAQGEGGSWEQIDYDEVTRYTTRVELENSIVTAEHEDEDNGAANVKIIFPPLVFGW